MIQPPHSRNRLEWYRFDQVDSCDWELILPDFYARLFEHQELAMMEKSDGGFHGAADHAGRRVCFAGLTPDDVAVVERFVDDFRRFVVLGLSNRMKPYFADELDLCLALDYNAESPADLAQFRRTPIGQLEYRAKYEQSPGTVSIIAEQMANLLERVRRCVTPPMSCLSYVPVSTRKQFDLPRELVRTLTGRIGAMATDGGGPLVAHPRLKSDKPAMKNLPLSSKVEYWRELTRTNAIALSASVVGQTVVVVDDLYQSGATLWSYAGYLKSQGAALVVGAVCVKSWRDTDNL